MWDGLNQRVKRDAIRQNDGPVFGAMTCCNFTNTIITKCLMLGHRLLANRIGSSANVLTYDVIARHAQLSGGIGQILDSLYQYSGATRTTDFHSTGSKRDNEKDIITFCKLLKKKN
ncbi:Hypothetical predicted protein [Mytilus galloprovincialis]|uniref:Uncharacterized protein n=1 Tax=Mytilus galloprovincialis TaxID=29158 RepID=A0A8B6E646_MYTGA|nr:Hypothetical predicted protein [Mytilus galloprovincialis]